VGGTISNFAHARHAGLRRVGRLLGNGFLGRSAL
jgi:hypothetical protein